jgi:hypothetical protein
MLDWITGIWTKPLATWTLLDILGLSVLFVVLWIGWLVASVALDTARISRQQEKAKNAPDYMDKVRKELGYDRSEGDDK